MDSDVPLTKLATEEKHAEFPTAHTKVAVSLPVNSPRVISPSAVPASALLSQPFDTHEAASSVGDGILVMEDELKGLEHEELPLSLPLSHPLSPMQPNDEDDLDRKTREAQERNRQLLFEDVPICEDSDDEEFLIPITKSSQTKAAEEKSRHNERVIATRLNTEKTTEKEGRAKEGGARTKEAETYKEEKNEEEGEEEEEAGENEEGEKVNQSLVSASSSAIPESQRVPVFVKRALVHLCIRVAPQIFFTLHLVLPSALTVYATCVFIL